MLVSPLDAPALFVLGVIAGVAYSRWLRRRNEDWFVVLGVVATSIAWLDLAVATVAGATPWLVAPTVQTGSVVLVVVYALAYPIWFWLGGRAVFLLVGRRPEEGGVLWLYRIEDETESFEPSWES